MFSNKKLLSVSQFFKTRRKNSEVSDSTPPTPPSVSKLKKLRYLFFLPVKINLTTATGKQLAISVRKKRRRTSVTVNDHKASLYHNLWYASGIKDIKVTSTDQKISTQEQVLIATAIRKLTYKKTSFNFLDDVAKVLYKTEPDSIFYDDIQSVSSNLLPSVPESPKQQCQLSVAFTGADQAQSSVHTPQFYTPATPSYKSCSDMFFVTHPSSKISTCSSPYNETTQDSSTKQISRMRMRRETPSQQSESSSQRYVFRLSPQSTSIQDQCPVLFTSKEESVFSEKSLKNYIKESNILLPIPKVMDKKPYILSHRDLEVFGIHTRPVSSSNKRITAPIPSNCPPLPQNLLSMGVEIFKETFLLPFSKTKALKEFLHALTLYKYLDDYIVQSALTQYEDINLFLPRSIPQEIIDSMLNLIMRIRRKQNCLQFIPFFHYLDAHTYNISLDQLSNMLSFYLQEPSTKEDQLFKLWSNFSQEQQQEILIALVNAYQNSSLNQETRELYEKLCYVLSTPSKNIDDVNFSEDTLSTSSLLDETMVQLHLYFRLEYGKSPAHIPLLMQLFTRNTTLSIYKLLLIQNLSKAPLESIKSTVPLLYYNKIIAIRDRAQGCPDLRPLLGLHFYLISQIPLLSNSKYQKELDMFFRSFLNMVHNNSIDISALFIWKRMPIHVQEAIKSLLTEEHCIKTHSIVDTKSHAYLIKLLQLITQNTLSDPSEALFFNSMITSEILSAILYLQISPYSHFKTRTELKEKMQVITGSSIFIDAVKGKFPTSQEILIDPMIDAELISILSQEIEKIKLYQENAIFLPILEYCEQYLTSDGIIPTEENLILSCLRNSYLAAHNSQKEDFSRTSDILYNQLPYSCKEALLSCIVYIEEESHHSPEIWQYYNRILFPLKNSIQETQEIAVLNRNIVEYPQHSIDFERKFCDLILEKTLTDISQLPPSQINAFIECFHKCGVISNLISITCNLSSPLQKTLLQQAYNVTQAFIQEHPSINTIQLYQETYKVIKKMLFIMISINDSKIHYNNIHKDILLSQDIQNKNKAKEVITALQHFIYHQDSTRLPSLTKEISSLSFTEIQALQNIILSELQNNATQEKQKYYYAQSALFMSLGLLNLIAEHDYPILNMCVKNITTIDLLSLPLINILCISQLLLKNEESFDTFISDILSSINDKRILSTHSYTLPSSPLLYSLKNYSNAFFTTIQHLDNYMIPEESELSDETEFLLLFNFLSMTNKMLGKNEKEQIYKSINGDFYKFLHNEDLKVALIQNIPTQSFIALLYIFFIISKTPSVLSKTRELAESFFHSLQALSLTILQQSRETLRSLQRQLSNNVENFYEHQDEESNKEQYQILQDSLIHTHDINQTDIVKREDTDIKDIKKEEGANSQDINEEYEPKEAESKLQGAEFSDIQNHSLLQNEILKEDTQSSELEDSKDSQLQQDIILQQPTLNNKELEEENETEMEEKVDKTITSQSALSEDSDKQGQDAHLDKKPEHSNYDNQRNKQLIPFIYQHCYTLLSIERNDESTIKSFMEKLSPDLILTLLTDSNFLANHEISKLSSLSPYHFSIVTSLISIYQELPDPFSPYTALLNYTIEQSSLETSEKISLKRMITLVSLSDNPNIDRKLFDNKIRSTVASLSPKSIELINSILTTIDSTPYLTNENLTLHHALSSVMKDNKKEEVQPVDVSLPLSTISPSTIATPLHNMLQYNGCYIHSSMISVLPAIALTETSERSPISKSIINHNFNYEHFTKLHQYGKSFGVLEHTTAYLLSNITKEDENKNKNKKGSELLNKDFTHYTSTRGLSLQVKAFDNNQKQCMITCYHDPQLGGDTFHIDSLKEIHLTIPNSELLVASIIRSDINTTTSEDPILASLVKNEVLAQHSALESNKLLLLNSIILYSSKMQHFITIFFDYNTEAWHIHTNSLMPTMPNISPGYITLEALLEDLYNPSFFLSKDSFIAVQVTYISEYARNRLLKALS